MGEGFFSAIWSHIQTWGWQNWLVVILYLAFTTFVGERLKGRQATFRDMFLGGRKLPWWAVSGSVLATEISAITFIAAPVIAFTRGDFHYLQLAFGIILGRVLIGFLFIPAYYKREIYSPYQYMGMRLGPRVDRATTLIFFISAVLGQGVRIFITAIVLQVVLNVDLAVALLIIGLFSITWILIGGITTVIWTDLVQFLIFVGGGIIGLYFAARGVDGGMTYVIQQGWDAGKFELFNFSFDLTEAYTFWAGLIGATFLSMASHGTDQMTTQRLFCCKNEKDARKAIIWSSVSQVVTLLMLVVGVGLFYYFQENPMGGEYKAMFEDQDNTLFPIFMVTTIPNFLSGLLIAGVIAAAISSLNSTIAALSQTSISTFYKPFVKKDGTERHYIVVSKVFIVFWGIVLCLMAYYCSYLEERFPDLIQLALGMTSYTYGALLGCLFLALLPYRRDDRGLIWAVPFSIMLVVGIEWSNPYMNTFIYIVTAILIGYGFRYLFKENVLKVLLVLLFAFLTLFINNFYYFPDNGFGWYVPFIVSFDAIKQEGAQFIQLAWLWNFPIGAFITLFLGVMLGKKKESTREFDYEYDKDGVLKDNS